MKTKISGKTVVQLIIRIILILAALYLINIYIGPLATFGIVNAGNFFGFAVSAVLIAISVFWTPLGVLLSKLWNVKTGKVLVSVICAAAIVFCSAFFITLSKIVSCSKYTASNQTTLIVLGCQIRGDNPSPTLKARCRAASEYLKNHPQAVAIASGGQGSDENLSEGECIFKLITARGIDKNRIFIEDQSRNTDENIKNSKKIIDDNKLSGDVAVATSDYHQYRASLICKKNGLKASSVPSRSSKRARATFFTREVFAVWAQYLLRK